MGDSSDEDLNSEDEFIDLGALWRDPVFLDESEPEDDNPDSIIDDDSPPRVIELTPYVPIPEEGADPLQNLMNEITDMSRRVTNARVIQTTQIKYMRLLKYLNRLQMARQRILDLGRPVVYRTRPMEEEVTTASPSTPPTTPQVMWSTNAGQSRNSEDQLPEDEQIPYRFNQLRHIVAGTAPIPPRWARGRQTFSMLSQNVGRMVDSSTQDEDESNFVDAHESETHFVLPAAIEEREKDPEPDEDDLADRALFVSDLVLSSLMRRTETPARYGEQSTSWAHNEPKSSDKEKTDSKPEETEEVEDPNANTPAGSKFKEK